MSRDDGPAPRTVQLSVSIDTEEDNWSPARDGVTVENVRVLAEHHRLLCDLGLRPTYFVSHAVAVNPDSASVISEIARIGGAEIGAHLHPWNTPPLDEPFRPRNTMMRNLSADLQREKLEVLRDRLGAVTGIAPTAFRAGRFGLGVDSIAPLIDTGFEVDSSVTPDVSWAAFDEGSEFWGAPRSCYRIAPDADPCAPSPNGPLWEVPVSTGFTRSPFGWRSAFLRRASAGPWRHLRLVGLASVTGLVKRVIGSPEVASLEELLSVSRCLVQEGATYVQLFWHSPSLSPGLSPFVRSDEDLARFLALIRDYVEGLARFAPVEGATVSEIAARAASR